MLALSSVTEAAVTTIALLGAGGKMGFRLSDNLRESPYAVRHVEISEAGRARLKSELAIDCVDQDTALDGAKVVILAVPDTLIGSVSHRIDSALAPGTTGNQSSPCGALSAAVYGPSQYSRSSLIT